MAQAYYLSNAINALITGAGAKPTTDPVWTAHGKFVVALAGCPPRPVPLGADASDVKDRADHLSKLLNAVSVCVTVILDAVAENLTGGLHLRQIAPLLSELESDVIGTLPQTAEGTTGRGA